MAYVVNSRLPFERTIYGDGLGEVIKELFERMAPKTAPIAIQLSKKYIIVIGENAPGAIVNIASKAFSTAKERLTRLMRRKSPSAKQHNYHL
jgi:hypothetical protein